MKKERIVVLGFLSHFPVAGVAWQTIHYLIGFQRLGYDVFYVECHDCTPSKLMRSQTDDGATLAAGYINTVMRRFDLANRWAYHAVSESRYFGLTKTELHELYRSAAAIINLHGSHLPTDELTATNRLVYLETDPVDVEIDLFNQKQETLDYLRPHCAFFTFGERIGQPDCLVPAPKPFQFQPTRQPVVIDFWKDLDFPSGVSFTTIGNWRQSWREVHFNGDVYRWSKHFEFQKFIDLPSCVEQQFELALSNCSEEEKRVLQSHGWGVRNPLEFSGDLDRYRGYIRGSRGEFTVAKDQNIRLRSGWFSDRSATYLAAGRPVITQETGFSKVLPTSKGLFAFSTLQEITSAVEAINKDYDRHRWAALEIARAYFSHEVVLGRLLSDLGLRVSPSKSTETRDHRLPESLSLVPTSRWPTRLPQTTIDTALKLPIPIAQQTTGRSNKRASIIIVTFNGLAYTKMCLASLFGAGWRESDELIVVDNGSTDGTREFLSELGRAHASVRIEVNASNRGFATANNQGLRLANGDILILLNNDTIVTRGWRDRLEQWLEIGENGLVGPVTNRTCNEAQIDSPYRTLPEMEEFAEMYVRQHRGESAEIPMLAMFCMAMRRDVFERVGPLDEQFEVGMFEDDDYARRVRQAGYKIICVEDVFVHHFGQAALGELCVTGDYDRILESNRRRFEAKWNVEWKPHGRRITPEYERLRSAIRHTVAQQLPSGATVLVMTKGDEELLRMTTHRGWHFPQDEHGRYPNIYPADSAEAITQLESGRAKGAGYLLIPRPALWWLDYYTGFKEHLERNYVLTVRDEETCLIFDVRGSHAG